VEPVASLALIGGYGQGTCYDMPNSGNAARLALISPCLLVCVACLQAAASIVVPLSPWKGGGFGMFATADSPGSRSLHVEVLDTDSQWRNVLIPFDQFDGIETLSLEFRRRVLVAPSIGRLSALANIVAASELSESASLASLTPSLAQSHYAAVLMPILGRPTLRLLSPPPLGRVPVHRRDARASVMRFRYERHSGLVRLEIVLSASAGPAQSFY
jgi:hypothetical protein